MSTNKDNELELLWKRLNRQGRYYDKPIKYTEFKAHIDKCCRLARLDELNQMYDEAETPERYDVCDVVHSHKIAQRITELKEKK